MGRFRTWLEQAEKWVKNAQEKSALPLDPKYQAAWDKLRALQARTKRHLDIAHSMLLIFVPLLMIRWLSPPWASQATMFGLWFFVAWVLTFHCLGFRLLRLANQFACPRCHQTFFRTIHDTTHILSASHLVRCQHCKLPIWSPRDPNQLT